MTRHKPDLDLSGFDPAPSCWESFWMVLAFFGLMALLLFL